MVEQQNMPLPCPYFLVLVRASTVQNASLALLVPAKRRAVASALRENPFFLANK